MDFVINFIKSFLYRTFRIILWFILIICVVGIIGGIIEKNFPVFIVGLIFSAMPAFILVKTKKKKKKNKIVIDNTYKESIGTDKPKSKNDKRMAIIDFISDYTLVDLETTGFSADMDEIIEISAIRVRDNQIVQTFSSLVKPSYLPIPAKIVELTGINSDMLKNAPDRVTVLSGLIDFIGSDIIVGYNIPFDLGFIDANITPPLKNNFIDILFLVKKILPKLSKKSLENVCEFFNISNENAHRGLIDCERTKAVYECLKENVIKNYGNTDVFVKAVKSGNYSNLPNTYHETKPVSSFIPKSYNFDKTHPVYGMYFVFTGELERMDRNTAMQKVVDLGGHLNASVGQKTNYLVCGSIQGNRFVKGKKTTKREKAEAMIADGANIEILTEKKFYDMIGLK